MPAVYLGHAELVCALGQGIGQCLHTLRDGGVTPQLRSLYAHEPELPFYAMPMAAPDDADYLNQQTSHARKLSLLQGLIPASLAGLERHSLLLIATSSLDVGAVEHGEGWGGYAGFARRIAQDLNWQGPVQIVNTACTSGLNALMWARALIANGTFADVVVLGIELENRLTLSGFMSLQLLSPDKARPYGWQRNGMVLGEALSVLHITAQVSSWQLLGGAQFIDAEQSTGTSAQAIVRVCQRALTQSQLQAHDVDLIKVQACGSVSLDAVEAQGLYQAFTSAKCVLPPLVSLKAAMGHTLGAAGIAETALLLACIDTHLSDAWPRVPDLLDPALVQSFGLRLAPRRPAQLRHVLVHLYGFGGSHTAVLLAKQG